jgi:hypothetical protein
MMILETQASFLTQRVQMALACLVWSGRVLEATILVSAYPSCISHSNS